MDNNIPFENTQIRGNRILKAIEDVCWGEMPDDGIFVPKSEIPVEVKEDIPPVPKPNIKNTLRQFWELREDLCEDTLSQKVCEMHIHKDEQNMMMIEEVPVPEQLVPMNIFKNQTPVKNSEDNPIVIHSTERKKVKIVRRNEHGPQQSPKQNLQTQATQAEYLARYQMAIPEPKLVKGKSTHSQRFQASSSSVFMNKKVKKTEATQATKSHAVNEDIEDFDDLLEDDPFKKQEGTKKLLEIDMNTTRRSEAHKLVDSLYNRGSLADQGLLKDQDITGFIEINAQETLEQAIRKAAQQPMTKCNDLC